MPYKDPAQKHAYDRAYHVKNSEKAIARARKHQLEHKEERAAYLKAYAAANRERLRAYHLKWTNEHREEQRIKNRKNALRHAAHTKVRKAAKYLANREEERQKRREYYAAHAEIAKANALIWIKANPEKAKAIQQRRRAQKTGAALNDFTHEQWLVLQEAFQHCCAYCGKHLKGKLTQDHITPLSKGGNHTLSNIVPACRSCNAKKHTNEALCPVQPLLL